MESNENGESIFWLFVFKGKNALTYYKSLSRSTTFACFALGIRCRDLNAVCVFELFCQLLTFQYF